MFSKGTWNALKGSTPIGGHNLPTSTAGANLLWKYAQKKDTKKKISDTINKAIPQRRPNSTIDEWRPCRQPSRLISRHHWNIIKTNKKKLTYPKKYLFKWNIKSKPDTKKIPLKALRIDQGDSFTKWNGWFFKLDNYFNQ